MKILESVQYSCEAWHYIHISHSHIYRATKYSVIPEADHYCSLDFDLLLKVSPMGLSVNLFSPAKLETEGLLGCTKGKGSNSYYERFGNILARILDTDG